MSILIKGMKMPKNCDSCWLSRMRGSSLGGILDCKIIGTVGAAMDDPHDILNNRHPDCPLIELPEKHGRLIDENEVRTVMNWLLVQPQRPTWNDTYQAIQEMNATVEAEGDEE